MGIDIHSYETILIDYFDGNLNALEVAEVLLFLEQHPEIKNEFEAFDTLPQAENFGINADFKSQLKKLNHNESLSNKSFNELIVAQMEGDCSVEETNLINEIIVGNQSLIKLKNTFQLTKLKPDLTLVYANKQSLKRKEAVVFYLTRKFAAAAVMLLFASLLFLIYRNTNQNIEDVKIAASKDAIRPKITNKNEVKNTPLPQKLNISVNTEGKENLNKGAQRKNTTILPMPAKVYAYRKNYDLKAIALKPAAKVESNISIGNSDIYGAIEPVEMLAYQADLNEATKAKDFLTIGDWMKKKFIERGKNNLIEDQKPFNDENITIDPIAIASVGAGIVEKTTGKKVFLSRSFDKSGSIKSYAFAAGNFKFERIK